MRIAAFITLVVCLAFPVRAQDTEQADKSYLESWLEGALSDAGRDVRVTGFQGALSSNARLDEMTISDDEGVWLTMRGASLVWSRSALLAGRLDVTELSATEIILTRLPQTDEGVDPSDAEAREFALPDLPVSIDVDTVRIGRIELGPEIIGEAAVLSAEGSFQLGGGEGSAELKIRRTDRADRLRFEGAYSNESRILTLDLELSEDDGGLVSNMLRIPGEPALELRVSGEAPISEYEARVALSSDGQRRLGGTVSIASLNEENERAGYGFEADLQGDLRPLFSADLRPFFGESTELALGGFTRPDGGLSIDRFEASSAALDLEGTLSVSPDGWPERFDVAGRIGDEEPVQLPLSGPATTINSAEISATFDATEGDAWQTQLTVLGLRREGLRVRRAGIAAEGTISRGAQPGVAATIDFDVAGLEHSDPSLARAIGPDSAGTARVRWQPDGPVRLENLSFESGDVAVNATGTLDSLEEGLPVAGEVEISAGDLQRFSGLAGRELDGSVTARIEGDGKLLGGAFDVGLTARTEALALGQPRVDPLLRGTSRLNLEIRRDTEGTTLERLNVSNDAVTASANGVLNAESGRLNLQAALSDIGLVEPSLSGPATLDTAFSWQAGGELTLYRLVATGADATLTATGSLEPEAEDLPAEGDLTLQANDLSRFARLAGRDLAGQIDVVLSGEGQIRGRSLDAVFELTGEDVRTGLAELDRLAAGDLSLAGELVLDRDAPPDLRYFEFDSARLKVNASGEGPGEPMAVSARISDLGLLAPGFSGPAAARGSVTVHDSEARRVSVELDANGPGGTTARISGDLTDYGASADIGMTGSAPLGLANRFITPRSVQGTAGFDLRLEGPLQLSSLSGTLQFSDARAALPRLRAALSGLTGSVRIGSGRAETEITGNAGTGGTFRVSGPITLSPPYPATLDISLNSLGVSDPDLFRTSLDGSLSMSGPLTGGAVISGTVTLGPTEIRVPSTGGVSLAELPEIRHVNEPAAVAATRNRAGLTKRAQDATAAFPLDITIRAPNRIFVRGRGLDAELGGQLRLAGTTADVNPSGVFELIRGRLDILTKRLVLTQGLIDLRGALDPYLQFVAETTAEDVLVRVVLEGLASSPDIRFSSEPELPQEEVVARLIFGRGLDSISPFQAAQLAGAVATLAGRGGGGLIGGFRESLGVSDLDVSTSDEGATQVRAGTYISENIYSEVTADSEGNQQIDLNLDLTPSITVKGRANTEGNTGIGIFFERDY